MSERPDPDEQQLPPLRQDLRLIQGSASGTAQAGYWKIHDPLAQRFYEVEQLYVDILAHWSAGTVGRLRQRLKQQLGREVSAGLIGDVIGFLQKHELLQAVPGATYARVRQAKAARERSLLSKALHGYLFLKVPLVQPDRFLRRTLPCVEFMFRRRFWCCVAALALISLYLVSQQWERFLSTLPDLFSVAGVATFGISLALVKALHELGHGYTAARMGAYVSSMGVALIVMFPVLYTDTTDAWRLASRRQRVLIDAAGMAVELLIAVIATLFWVFLPDGALRHVAFVLATTGWVLSLAINLNPLMRFDGYYLFSDLIGVPNLQERSFAMGRWWLREVLFGYGDEQPEFASPRKRYGLIVFAFATWLYRFFLFLGIALLVYHFFFKVLGLFMFAVELGWFIVLPIWRELKVWFSRRQEATARGRTSVLLGALLLLAFLLPWPYMVRIPAVLTAAQQVPAFAPRPARIEQVLVAAGQTVRAQQVILQLSAPELEQQLENARKREQLLVSRLDRGVSDSRDLSESLVLGRELRLERDRILGFERERARLVVRAPIDGVVMELTPELHAGRWVDATTQLVLIAQPQQLEVRGYLDSEDLARVQVGEQGQFIDEQFRDPPLAVQVKRIAAAASDTLDNWLLASTHGGTVAARADRNAPRSEYAVFEVAAQVSQLPATAPLTEVRGEIQLRGDWQSLALRMFSRVMRVLIRESAA